jgi:hypothetical protein
VCDHNGQVDVRAAFSLDRLRVDHFCRAAENLRRGLAGLRKIDFLSSLDRKRHVYLRVDRGPRPSCSRKTRRGESRDEALKIWPVEKMVGNVRNNGPQLILPVLSNEVPA